ncbi:MAG: DEAD/DEAH box helicase [Acidobacteria bacterium]|nr:DEAD/DEAH box helicase [Acidobacteriota bacterium]MCB9398398.1 DEAD/DEAH box helicase [Acidobacteriota bacterium]
MSQLHPALTYHITNSLGWSHLRPLQKSAIPPLLAGEDALLVAPTASGKTEAALFPLLSRMLSEHWQPLSVLYLCPLKALINNLSDRIEYLCGLVGRSARYWHGDLSQAHRKKIRLDAPDILITTPESLEVMLVSRTFNHRTFFTQIRAVVVDEIHAFGGDDRGWHLSAVLSRIQAISAFPIQRVGLSATVGNPEGLLTWFKGDAERPGRVICPPAGPRAKPEVILDFVGSYENAAQVIAQLHKGEKRLVFVDSRSGVERLTALLRAREVETFASHSSLSQEERAISERAFSESRNCVIVATSTLELGIDVGDLDRVIQIDSPSTVAGFLQRLGRTGRRAGTHANCLFLATDEMRFLQAAGLIHLWGTGFVEPIVPPALPYHILAQQVMALTLQEDQLNPSNWENPLKSWPALKEMGAQKEELIKFLLDQGILFSDQGVWMMGEQGEKQYGFRFFNALFSVFMAPLLLKVLYGRTEIGEVDPANFFAKEHLPVISLGGRGWKVEAVDWQRKEVQVQPLPGNGRSMWRGSGPAIHFELAQACRQVLLGAELGCTLSQRASNLLSELRQDMAGLDPASLLMVNRAKSIQLWTFAGSLANLLLAQCLTDCGLKTQPSVYFVESEARSGAQFQAVWPKVLQMAQQRIAPTLSPEMESGLKFAECVPDQLLKKCLQKRWGCSHAINQLAKTNPNLMENPDFR